MGHKAFLIENSIDNTPKIRFFVAYFFGFKKYDEGDGEIVAILKKSASIFTSAIYAIMGLNFFWRNVLLENGQTRKQVSSWSIKSYITVNNYKD